MKMAALTPTRLRLMLIAIMAILLVVGVCVFLYGREIIAEFAKESQVTAAQATDSSSSLEKLKKTKELLEKESATVDRTTQLVAESQQYVYQDKIIEDITKYASDAGLGVTNITFSDIKTATTAATPATGAAAPSTPAPANIKTRTATVTLANPVDYYKTLNFIHSIEQGLFRMRVSSIGLSRTADAKSGNNITSDVLTIEVYVR